jgi:hypothetical protein
MLSALLDWLFKGVASLYDWLFASGRGQRRTNDLRQDLVKTRDEIRRQIDILALGPVNWRDATPQTARMLEELRADLAHIEREIADLP